MHLHTSKYARVVALFGATGLVVASAGFGALYAYKIGIQHSIALAGLSILMALALEGIKPLAIAAGLHSLKEGGAAPLLLMGLGGIACAYSLTSELSLVSMSKGDLVAERLAEGNGAKRRELELAALGTQRPARAIQADLDGILSDTRLKGCTKPLEARSLAKLCKDKVAPLKAELANAERREVLLSGTVGAAKDSDPGSTAISTYLALAGVSVAPAIISQWLLLVPVLALEIGSALAMVLVQAFPKPIAGPAVAHSAISTAYALPTEVQPEPKKVEEVKSAVLDLLRASGGSTAGGERGLAKRLGSNRGTLGRAVSALVVAGMISLEATKAGTVLRLIS